MRRLIALCIFAIAGTQASAQSAGLAWSSNGSVVFGSGSGLSAYDLNGDCFTTHSEVALRFLELNSWTLNVGDLDGDGIESVADTLICIEKFIRASFADVNSDGVIDIHDAIVVSASVGDGEGAALTADVTSDGDVDAADLVTVYSKVGEPIGVTDLEFSQAAWAVYQAAAVYANAGIRSIGASYADCTGDPYDPQVHHMSISSDWVDNDHDTEVSAAWPPNHEYEISEWWDDYGHDLELSQTEKWPANHEACYSNTWASREVDDCPGVTHSLEVSETRPDHHDERLSAMWDRAPNHIYEISMTWNESDHSILDSRTWPTNHQYVVSLTSYPITGHDEMISLYPGYHGVDHSGQWPSNHVLNVSDGWNNSHSVYWSAGWPSNHQAAVSSTWPNPVYPGAWPPNHMVAASGGNPPGGGGSWEEWFPPNHYIMQSLIDMWDIPSDILDLILP